MRIVKRKHQRSRRRQRGFMTMELVLTLPILGLILLALFEFSVLFFARGEVVAASRTGARHAALTGARTRDVESEVRRVLSPRLRQAADVQVYSGDRTGDLVSVVVRVPMGAAAPNLLWPIGINLKGRHLVSTVHMVRE